MATHVGRIHVVSFNNKIHGNKYDLYVTVHLLTIKKVDQSF